MLAIPYLYFLIAIFIFGIIIGSFLNVVIFRLGGGKSLGGRSHCMTCGKVLRVHELVPVFSFLFQAGRCTKCKSKLSWQYPLVELSAGVFAVLTALIFIPHVFTLVSILTFLFFFSITCVLLVIAVYDIRHKIIPNKMVFLFIFLALVNLFLVKGGLWAFGSPGAPAFWAGILIPLPFAILFYLSRGTVMGFGDIKLMSGMGFLLGISSGISALMISFWLGAIFGIGLLIFGKKYKAKSQIPFGPFLVFSTILIMFFPITLDSIIFFITKLFV